MLVKYKDNNLHQPLKGKTSFIEEELYSTYILERPDYVGGWVG